MKKYKGRKDLGGIAKMMGKLKNPSEETIANLKDISQVLAEEEKVQDSSAGIGGTVVTPVEPSEMEIPENASNKTEENPSLKEQKKKEKEKEKEDIERLKLGDALKKAKEGDDLSVNTSNTTDLDMDMGGSIAAKILGKRKARKKEEEEAKRKAKQKYKMTEPEQSEMDDPIVPEPTL